MANAHAAHAHACDAGDGCTVQDLRVQTRQAGFANTMADNQLPNRRSDVAADHRSSNHPHIAQRDDRLDVPSDQNHEFSEPVPEVFKP